MRAGNEYGIAQKLNSQSYRAGNQKLEVRHLLQWYPFIAGKVPI